MGSSALSMAEAAFAARVCAKNESLRSGAHSAVAVVREIARIIRWFDSPQEEGAVGPRRGICSDHAFSMNDDVYLVRALPVSPTGHPAFCLSPTVDTMDAPTNGDQRTFYSLVDRLSAHRAITEWATSDGYCVSLAVPVHETLKSAVTRNMMSMMSRKSDAPTRIIQVPDGWHV